MAVVARRPQQYKPFIKFLNPENSRVLIKSMDNDCLLGIQSKVYKKLLKEKEEI